MNGIGKIMALVAAVAVGVMAKDRVPDQPVLWVIAAGVAAMMTYALRKLIVFGAIAALIFFVLTSDRDKDDEGQPAAPAAGRSYITG